MTRLRSEDISDISAQLREYDKELVSKTGRTLSGIACHAINISEKEYKLLQNTITFAVVPIRSGKGIISSFSDTVRDIVIHLGVNAFITHETDVAGIEEAVEKGAEVIMMADDLRFIALHIKTGLIVDNNVATAKAFIAGLDLMTGGISQHRVLVLGCGPIGRYSVHHALQRGAHVSVFDVDKQRSQDLVEDIYKITKKTILIEDPVNQGNSMLSSFNIIIDATNSADIIEMADISSKTNIAAPGMPSGLSPAAVVKINNRLLHDPLQLGVSVMAVEMLKGIKYER